MAYTAIPIMLNFDQIKLTNVTLPLVDGRPLAAKERGSPAVGTVSRCTWPCFALVDTPQSTYKLKPMWWPITQKYVSTPSVLPRVYNTLTS